ECRLIGSLLDETARRVELRLALVPQRMGYQGRQDYGNDERAASPDKPGGPLDGYRGILRTLTSPAEDRVAQGEKRHKEPAEHGGLTKQSGRDGRQIEGDGPVGQRPPGSPVGGLRQVEDVMDHQ